MNRYRLRVISTVLLTAILIVAFSWIAAWQNYLWLSRDASREKNLTREAVNDTLENLSASWTDYERKLINRYEVEAVLASLALQNVIEDENAPALNRGNNNVISIKDGRLSSSNPAVSTLGLDASLFRGEQGSFAAPGQPSTYVAYSISASSITLYDSNGRETVSSGQWISLELGSDPDSSEDLEQMLKTELPKIGRTDRRILSGPTYNGITALGNGTMTLSVSADCNEEDFFYVRDKLNVSLQRIFREHEYSI